MSPMNAPLHAEFDDIQGLVRYAHGRLTEAAFVLLRIKDADTAVTWLERAPITSAAPVSPLPNTALQVAFTVRGLKQLGVPEDIINGFSEAFTGGLNGDENRSRRLGDTGVNHPSQWRWGSDEKNSPHLLLMVYTLPGKLTAYLRDMRQDDFETAFEIQHTLRAKSRGPEEPFGFVDGISQPLVDWQQAVSTDLHERDNYSNLLALGEVLLGYPNEYGLYTDRPVLNLAKVPAAKVLPVAADNPGLKDLGRNGSYLVLRQLAQDVTGFWQFIDRQSDSDADRREQLAAAMVGRQRDGTALVEESTSPIQGIGLQQANNQFTFDDDLLGQQCPVGAHIRRANPRTGDFPPGVTGLLKRLQRTLGFGRRRPTEDLVASTRFHRILRRGRVYGSTLTPEQALRDTPLKKAGEERGLHFVCLGANISRQFEFVQNAWVMSSKFAGLSKESDPLLGNRDPLASGQVTDEFTLPREGEPAQCIQGIPQFVSVRGGAYFFMPGLRALTFILQVRHSTNPDS
jgi:deferrochelatase/peroxidase EfeB